MKERVTADMLQAMVEAAGMESSLTEVRLLVVCLLAFAGFLRCDELIKFDVLTFLIVLRACG